MKNRKVILTSIIVAVLIIATLGATYAYFQAKVESGSSTSVKVTASTLDSLTFATGNPIELEANQTNFASGQGNIVGSTYASATLIANNASNTATSTYNMYLNISDNNFAYSQSSTYPELILKIKNNSTNEEVTSIEGLNYVSTTDAKGTTITGFDITTKVGLVNLFNGKEIKTATGQTTITAKWDITIQFVNYAKDQTSNENKFFNAQVLIGSDQYEENNSPMINYLSISRSASGDNFYNLKVALNTNVATSEISEYHYGIVETNSLTEINNVSKNYKIMPLAKDPSDLDTSDTCTAKKDYTTLEYVTTNLSSNSFSCLSYSDEYTIYAYVVNKQNIKSNTYILTSSEGGYDVPTISSVTATKTSNSITVTVSAQEGTNKISKYLYSIDNGNSFLESTSNIYTFNNLKSNNLYRIIVKVKDSNEKYSNVYVTKVQTENSSTNLISFTFETSYSKCSGTFTAESGMTWNTWINSSYNNLGCFTLINDVPVVANQSGSYSSIFNKTNNSGVMDSDTVKANSTYTTGGMEFDYGIEDKY